RRAADDLDAAARLAQGGRARRLPALYHCGTEHHARRHRLGDARPCRPDASADGAAPAPPRNLDRLAALRAPRRAAVPAGAGLAADRLRRDTHPLGANANAARSEGSRGAFEDALYSRLEAPAARFHAVLSAPA